MASGCLGVTKSSVWRTAVSCSFFLRREAVGNLRFDERLGVGSGTPLGSGEETEFLLRLLEQGRHLLYDGSLTVYHPVFRGPWRVARGWTYGCGHGWVLRRHRYGMWRLFWAMAIQGARAMQAVLTGGWRKAPFHLAQAAGRFWGYAVLWRRITPGRCA